MTQKKNNNRADRGANRRAGNSPVLTDEQRREQLARELGIKPKTRAFVDKLLEDPTLTQTEAYIATHKTNSVKTAKSEASKLLQRPAVIGYKDSAVGKAKRRIVTLVDSNNENTALKAAQDIIDRTEGKAIQKSENISRTVEVKLDLTGVRLGAHYVKQ